MSGGSQAVRIPAEFRFNTDEVYVRRDQQSGDLILSGSERLDSIFDALDAVVSPRTSSLIEDSMRPRDGCPKIYTLTLTTSTVESYDLSW